MATNPHRPKSKSAVVGGAVAVVVALAILGASFGLKIIGENRSETVSGRGAAAADRSFFDRDFCVKDLWTRFAIQNELPFDVTIGSVTDVDVFDWCNSANGNTVFLPSDPAEKSWGLMGLAIAPGTIELREISPRITSIGSPFTLLVVDGAGQPIGEASFDVQTLEYHRGSVVFRGDNLELLTAYSETRAIGAVIVGGQARSVMANLESSAMLSTLTLSLL